MTKETQSFCENSETITEPKMSRRALLAAGLATGVGAVLLGASPGQADVLRSLKGFLYLDPLVANFAFEMEELESEYFSRVSLSEGFNSLSSREKSLFNLMAEEDREHFNTIKMLRARNQQKGAGALESSNASGGRRPGVFRFPSRAFATRDTILPFALELKETVLYAYHGAVDLVDKKTLSLAAAIAGVEGRHVAVLREIQGLDPVPSPFEMSLQPDQVGRKLSKYGFNGGGYGFNGGNR